MVLDKAYKKVVASIMALCMASTMMLYTPSGNLINEVLVDATITVNSGGFAFNDTGGTAGSTGTWKCATGIFGYRVYPVSLTAMLSNDAQSVEDTIAKYDKCSIFISNTAYSNHNKYYHNKRQVNGKMEYTLIDIDSNQYFTQDQCAYLCNNEEGTFERFLSDAFSFATTSNLTTNCNNAMETAQNAMNTTGNQRMLFDSYINFLVNTCGLSTEDSLYTDLQNMFATNCTTPGVTSESDFMIIVEPMRYIYPGGSVSKGGYMSLMESLKVIQYFDRNSNNATKLPANVFTGEKMSMIDNSNQGWHYSNFGENKCWASNKFYSDTWDNPAANASCYIYPFRHILPKLDAEKVTDQTLLDRINGTKDTDKDGNLDGQYVGFCWYSLSNGGVQTTNTYSITEEASVITDGKQTDFLEEEVLNLPLANGGTETVNVKTALMNGIISNETITKNYYRRTTEEENRDTILKALNLETLKEATPTYDTITLSSDIENAKSNSEYSNFYYSVSPFQQGEKIELQKALPIEEDHKDYILGQTVNAGSINTTGKLNYSNLTEITDKTLLSNMEDVMNYTVDSTDDYKLDLTNIKLEISLRDLETNEIQENYYVGMVEGRENVTALVNAVQNGYNLLSSNVELTCTDGSTIKLTDVFKGLLNRKYPNQALVISLNYEYQVDGGTIPYETSSGSFNTTIPAYSLNNYYAKLEDTENLVATDNINGNVTTRNGELVNAKIYAPVLLSSNFQVNDNNTVNRITIQPYIPTQQSALIDIAYTLDANVDKANTETYNNSRVLENSTPIISEYEIDTFYKAEYPQGTISEYAPVEVEYANYNTSFYATKTASLDKVTLANWITSSNSFVRMFDKGTTYYKTEKGTNRTVDATYSILSNTIPLISKVSLLDINEKRNQTNELIVAESPYDTQCKIYNYDAKQITDTYTGTDTIVNLTSTDIGSGSNITYFKNGATGIGTWTIIPEVSMSYETTSGNSTITKVKGNQPREVKQLSMTGLILNSNISKFISGTVEAIGDAKIDTLRSDFNSSTTNCTAPVLYAGSEVVAAVDLTQTEGTFKTYVLDIDDNAQDAIVSKDSNIKSAEDVARNAITTMLGGTDTLNINLHAQADVYTDWNSGTKGVTFDFKDTTVTATPTKDSEGNILVSQEATYKIEVKDGKVVGFRDSTGNKITDTKKLTELKSAVAGLDLDNMFTKNFEIYNSSVNNSGNAKYGPTLAQDGNGNTVVTGATKAFTDYWNSYGATDKTVTDRNNNWYSEETSIFVIKVYSTPISAQTVLPLTAKIPINAGPATATSNKAYFDKGYGATISYSLTTEIGGNTIKLAEETGQGDTPDFIIPNLNVNNLYN